MFQLNKTANIITVAPDTRISELKHWLSRDGLYFGYHPLLESDEGLEYYLTARIPNLYHFKFGSLADLVSSVTFEFNTGMHFRLKDAPRAAIGPDFNRLVIGSGKRWGSFHDVTLKLTPLPERIRCALIRLPDAPAAQQIITQLIGYFMKPLFFKHFDKSRVRRLPAEGGKKNVEALLVCLSGLDEIVRVEEDFLSACCSERGHDVRWLEIIESQELMNKVLFNDDSYQQIRRQYQEFLWPAADGTHQAMIEKKLFESA